MILERHRIQLDVTTRMREVLDELVDKTEATNRGEVLRRAVSIYNAIILAVKDGKSVELVGGGDRERLLIAAVLPPETAS